MTDLYDGRRYLTQFDVNRIPNLFVEVLVIGSGVAGLRAAIEAARFGSVILVTKGQVHESNTDWAQGGIASAMGPNDTREAHVKDTLRVGCGLCDPDAVARVVEDGPGRVQELAAWGALFDRRGTALQLGLEGGHSAPRIVHAQGDATGREVSRTLIQAARATQNLRLFEDCFVVDLVVLEGRCLGVTTYHRHFGHQIFWAKQTILATGGCGQLYRETTNPDVATADGHALAYRAGVPVRDMEMLQFHPTALYVAGAARSLISEAVRGEGAYLVDRNGRRFMEDYHPGMELAPRDVVSRAILSEIAKQDATCMYLDVRHLDLDRFRKRFPSISRQCEDVDIDVASQLIPIRPAAHYMIGGVVVDNDTRTPLPGLLACGEAASTGVHGANRLASNSLLEGLVFGAIAGRIAGESAAAQSEKMRPEPLVSQVEPSTRTPLDLNDVRNSLRSVMWRNVGITRTGSRLAETEDILLFWGRYVMDKLFDDRQGWEIQNMLTVARLMAASALAREESRGVHFREDFPDIDPALDGRHAVVQRTDAGPKVELSPAPATA